MSSSLSIPCLGDYFERDGIRMDLTRLTFFASGHCLALSDSCSPSWALAYTYSNTARILLH
ncbi:Hypothetical protein PHPALM_6929 [Phytophthora palmivora]|uniref:Uncharacterized protein n=1 Tax=Phytophthora palmivora TaxID=4796 RepID=A0A2P4YDN2_9STRA|nr:Hypothetical protein PHPALM_6929 [Phytophthora palmivora]